MREWIGDVTPALEASVYKEPTDDFDLPAKMCCLQWKLELSSNSHLYFFVELCTTAHITKVKKKLGEKCFFYCRSCNNRVILSNVMEMTEKPSNPQNGLLSLPSSERLNLCYIFAFNEVFAFCRCRMCFCIVCSSICLICH